MMEKLVLIALLVFYVLSGCGSSTPVGGVRVITNVSRATLLVDDELRGPLSEYEGHYIRLAPGPHRLTLEHDDYRTEHVAVTVVEEVGVTVSIQMRPRHVEGQQEGNRSNVLPSTP